MIIKRKDTCRQSHFKIVKKLELAHNIVKSRMTTISNNTNRKRKIIYIQCQQQQTSKRPSNQQIYIMNKRPSETFN